MSLTLTLTDLFVHPVKSAASLKVPRATISDTGLQYDREWMVVDADGEFLSQREQPRMALIRCELRHSELVLRAPGMIPLHLQLDAAEGELTARVWNDAVPAFDMGALASQWCSDFLGIKGLKLAAWDTEARRLSDPRWSAGVQALNAFSDGFPLLVLSRASLQGLNTRLQDAGRDAVTIERFRPNLVIDGVEDPHGEDQLDTLSIETDEGPVVIRLTKPCPRCPMPDVDPSSGTIQPGQVSDILQGYRQHPAVGGAVAFGMNAVIVSGIGRTIREGARVTASLAL